MDTESQYLLFALSSPMEVLNKHCQPSHSAPGMYLGMESFDLASSWDIESREDLIQTIGRMLDNGHATQLAGLYHRWFRLSPMQWRAYTDELNETGRLYAAYVASTAECCGEGGIKAWDYVRMGFLSRIGVLNKWLTEEESLWIQSRIHVRALHHYSGWLQYFAAYCIGRKYWQAPDDDDLPLLREILIRKEYCQSGNDMFHELIGGGERFYMSLPWRYLAEYPARPATLTGMGDI